MNGAVRRIPTHLKTPETISTFWISLLFYINMLKLAEGVPAMLLF